MKIILNNNNNICSLIELLKNENARRKLLINEIRYGIMIGVINYQFYHRK